MLNAVRWHGLCLLNQLVLALGTIEMLSVAFGVFFHHITAVAIWTLLGDRFVPGGKIAFGILGAAPEDLGAASASFDDITAATGQSTFIPACILLPMGLSFPNHDDLLLVRQQLSCAPRHGAECGITSFPLRPRASSHTSKAHGENRW